MKEKNTGNCKGWEEQCRTGAKLTKSETKEQKLDKWLIDSGASVHVTIRKKILNLQCKPK